MGRGSRLWGRPRKKAGTPACKRAGPTFVCIASGPSLTQADVDRVKGKAKVVAVNDNYRLAPWADFLYACDAKWWEHHEPLKFAGEKWTQCPVDEKDGMGKTQRALATKYGLKLIPGAHRQGLGDPHVNYGSNSGYQAINLAYLLGAGVIILLGYDMQRTAGKQHWFGDHPPGPMQVASDYGACIGLFPRLGDELSDHGVAVINCTRETALTCFRRAPLNEVFI